MSAPHYRSSPQNRVPELYPENDKKQRNFETRTIQAEKGGDDYYTQLNNRRGSADYLLDRSSPK